MSDIPKKAVEKIQAKFADEVLSVEESSSQTVINVKSEKIVDILTLLKNDSELSFDFLKDIGGIDYLNQGKPERFAVAYQLFSFKNAAHFRVKAFVAEDELEIDTATSLWKSANWPEREVYDMYGLDFLGHPDLTRILLPEGYQGHPLRKDYPLRGKGEREDFPKYIV